MLQYLQSLWVLCYDAVHMVVGIVCSILESVVYNFKPPAVKPVEGEIALVVGASQGIGREFAVQLASLGAVVVCWDVNDDESQENNKRATAAQGCKGKIYSYCCDVSNREQVSRTAQLVKQEVGDVSILIQCGNGPSPRTTLSQLSQGISQAMALNVFSYFWVLEAFLPSMKKRNHGHVVMLSSVALLNGIREQVALRTAQFAVKGLAESLTEELRVTGVLGVHLTLAHIHPSVITPDLHVNTPVRVPHYFGMPDLKETAHEILNAMRRNYPEVSVPPYLCYLGNIYRILPPSAAKMLREILDTGVDAC